MVMVRKSIVILICFFLLYPSFITASPSHPETEQSLTSSSQLDEQIPTTSPIGGSRYNIQGWVYVNIKGDAFERGYQYGYLAGEEIIDLMLRWSKMILNHPRIKPIRPILSNQQYDNIAETWWEFCKNLAERMYWEEYPDEYRQEIKGIAAGVNERKLTLYGDPLSYRDVLASNEMYEILSKITDRKIRKSIHPIHSLFALINPTLSQFSSVTADEFITDFYPDVKKNKGHHHCSAFIATGNATAHDELIIANSMWSSIDGAGMWWWSYYIAIRWNIILDVIPTNGNRFQMSCAPGYIWSDHDFYQNERGIVFLETTNPQGIWSEKGYPLAVRARKAVQYANSIDDVIHFLKKNNDGVMNAVWLIGDTKTGEIARYELGLYRDAVIERTTDGFQWSSNNPIDFWVRLEKMDWKMLIKQLLYSVFLGFDNYQYHTPWYLPAARDIAFEKLGNKYYGEIDVEIVKRIMGTDPIGTYSPDCKMTTTSLLDHNGLLVHTGNPGGETLSMAYFDSPDVYYESLKPIGWVEVFGLPRNHSVDVNRNEQQCGLLPETEWKISLENQTNDFYSMSTYVDNVIYSTTSSGILYAVSEEGDVLWKKKIGGNPTKPMISDNQLFVGSDKGLTMIDLGWLTMGTKPVGSIKSNPVVNEHFVFVGTTDHSVYAIHKESGRIHWSITVDGVAYLSNTDKDILIVAGNQVVTAVNASHGNVLWTQQLNGIVTSCPHQEDGQVYIGSWDTDLYALDQKTGKVLWTIDTGWGIESTPIEFDQLVLFASHDQNVYAINKSNGQIEWLFSCRAAVHTNPVIWKESVIIGSDDGRLYRLDGKTGSLLWCFAPGDTIQDAKRNYVTTPIRSTVAVSSEQIFIGSLGYLYSIS